MSLKRASALVAEKLASPPSSPPEVVPPVGPAVVAMELGCSTQPPMMAPQTVAETTAPPRRTVSFKFVRACFVFMVLLPPAPGGTSRARLALRDTGHLALPGRSVGIYGEAALRPS